MTKFSLKLQGRVLFFKAYGIWCSRDIDDFIEQAEKLIKSISDTHWAVITDLSDWELGTPDFEDKSDKFQQWCAEQGQTHEAIIGSGALTRFQADLILKGAQQKGLTVEYFQTQQQAIQWLHQQGFPLDSAS